MSDTTNLSIVVEYTEDDDLLYINIPFEWIDEEDLHVAISGEPNPLPRPAPDQNATTWRFINRQRIQIVNPVVGTSYRVERRTSTDNVYAEFVPGTPIRSQDLNSNFKQTLHVVQENTGDRWARTGDTMSGNISMATLNADGNPIEGPFKITNLKTPEVSTDAANKGFVDDAITNAFNNVDVAVNTLNRYLGPLATLPVYLKSDYTTEDVPPLGTLAFQLSDNRMYMLIASVADTRWADWQQVIESQVNPLRTYRTTIYPEGSGAETVKLTDLGTSTSAPASDLPSGTAYILNDSTFPNTNFQIPQPWTILQVNGAILKPHVSVNNPGEYSVVTGTSQSILIDKGFLDAAPYGSTAQLEFTFISFADVELTPKGWQRGEWAYNSETNEWELTLVGDDTELDVTVNNLQPKFFQGTVTSVPNVVDAQGNNVPGNPTFTIVPRDSPDNAGNEYDINMGIPVGGDPAQIASILIDTLSGYPKFTLTNGVELTASVDIRGDRGPRGYGIGSADFQYQRAAAVGNNSNLTSWQDGIVDGKLPLDYLDRIKAGNTILGHNPGDAGYLGFDSWYLLVGNFILEDDDGNALAQEYNGAITNPRNLVGPPPILSIGGVSEGTNADVTLTDDSESGDGYKLNFVIPEPRISTFNDRNSVTSFAAGELDGNGDPFEEELTVQYYADDKEFGLDFRIQKADPPTFSAGNVTAAPTAESNEAAITFTAGGSSIPDDYTIDVTIPITSVNTPSGTETRDFGDGDKVYTNGIYLSGDLNTVETGAYKVHLDQLTKGDLGIVPEGHDKFNELTAQHNLYLELPVQPAPQLEIDTTIEFGDTPSITRGHLDAEGTWQPDEDPDDPRIHNWRFVLPKPIKVNDGNPNDDNVSGVDDQLIYDYTGNRVYKYNGTNNAWDLVNTFGQGISQVDYASETGKVTITHEDPNKSITTDDLRAPGFTGGTYDATTGEVTFTSNGAQGGTDVVTGDLRGQFFPQGEVSALPTDLGADDVGKNYLLTQDGDGKQLGHTYYWNGTGWNDLGFTRGIQGVSISNISIDDSSGTAKLSIELDNGTTPVNAADVMPPRMIPIEWGVNTWPSTGDQSADGEDVLGSPFLALRDDDTVLMLGSIETAGGDIVAGPGQILKRTGTNLELIGSLRGPEGNNYPFGGNIFFEGEAGTFAPKSGFKNAYYLVAGNEYTIAWGPDTPAYTDWGIYTNTTDPYNSSEIVLGSTTSSNFKSYGIRIPEFLDGWEFVIGPSGKTTYAAAYAEASANMPNSPAGINGYHLIKVFRNAHSILTNITAGRFISEGDVLITEDPSTGMVTVNNTNKVTVEQPVPGNFTGSHELDKVYTGNLLNFKSDDSNSEITLPDLEAGDTGVTVVINNTGNEKLAVKGITNGSQVILAGRSTDVSKIDVAPRGMLHATYLHDAYESGTGRAWVILGQGLTGVN